MSFISMYRCIGFVHLTLVCLVGMSGCSAEPVVEEFCGNGVLDVGELCDGDCPTECDDGLACTRDVLLGDPTDCAVVCRVFPVELCLGGDGCCPSGCDGVDADCSEIAPECEAGVTEEASCGLNGAGVMKRECVDGFWLAFGTCVDPDICENGREREGETLCGVNLEGVLHQVCGGGQWEDDPENCTGQDVCVNGVERLGATSCGFNDEGAYPQVCISGRWVDLMALCTGTDSCTNGSLRPSSFERCGLNQEGARFEACVGGEWELTVDDCSGTDVCVNEVEETRSCVAGDVGEQSRVCSRGQWEAWGACRVCEFGTKQVEECGLNGESERWRWCAGGVWADWVECENTDPCIDGAEIRGSVGCGTGAGGYYSKTCLGDRWTTDLSQCVYACSGAGCGGTSCALVPVPENGTVGNCGTLQTWGPGELLHEVGEASLELWRVTTDLLGTWDFTQGDLSHTVGHQEDGNWAVASGDSGEGFLCWGPYITTLPVGELQAYFDLRLGDNLAADVAVATLDVYDATTGVVLNSRELTGADSDETGASQRFELTFTQAAGHESEFRVYWKGVTELTFERVTVTQARQPGFLSYGPFVSELPSGSHLGVYTLAISDIDSEDLPLSTLDVYDVTTQTVLAERVVTRAEFESSDTMQAFYLPYNQQSGHSIEFRVFWHGNSVLSLKDVGVLQGYLESGDTCLPGCDEGYAPLGESSCVDGTFRSAVCAPDSINGAR